MYNLNAGRLRDRVAFYRYVDKIDEFGRNNLTLEKFRSVWAEVRPMRGCEFLEYYRERNRVQFKVTCRFFEDCNEKLVLRFNDVDHEITAVIDIENRHKILEIMCEERVDELKKVTGWEI